MVLLCKHFAPALVLSLLDLKLGWDAAEEQASIQELQPAVKAQSSEERYLYKQALIAG